MNGANHNLRRTWFDGYPSRIPRKRIDTAPEYKPTRLFNEVLGETTVKYCGRVDKFAPMRNRMSADEDFGAFCADRGYNWQQQFDVPPMNARSLLASVAKYGKEDVVLTDEQQLDLDWATEYTMLEFRPHLSKARWMGVDEVVSNVEMGNSPGFPWNMCYGTSQHAYDDNASWFTEYVRNAKANPSSLDKPCIFNLFPKEELLPADKVKMGKLRSISGCPLEFKLLSNSLLLAQNEGFYDAHGITSSEVGINPYNGGWNQLYNKLLRTEDGVEWRGQALDVSAFDCSFSKAVSKAVYDIRWECMPASMQTAECKALLEYIRASIFEGYLITPAGEVLLRDHGNSSGSPNTVVDNTIGLRIGMLYAYKRACRAAGRDADYFELADNHSAALYGDDNTFTASRAYEGYLSCESLSAGFAELGWVITSETDGWVSLMELTFLQRQFLRRYDGLVVPVPTVAVKALDAMLRKGRGGKERSYKRACGLLQHYWYNPVVRVILSAYLDELEQTHFDTNMHARVRANRLSPGAMEALYGPSA